MLPVLGWLLPRRLHVLETSTSGDSSLPALSLFGIIDTDQFKSSDNGSASLLYPAQIRPDVMDSTFSRRQQETARNPTRESERCSIQRSKHREFGTTEKSGFRS